jgi:NAD(P)-dependent dehydrogenase (short-subunit alcohol dehydrogenase family)
LGGQVAIVTGGGRGIGRSIAHGLAAAGVALAVTARSENQLNETVREIRQAGGRALAVAADVTEDKAVARLVETVERDLGPITLLVNNAGIGGPIGPLWEVAPDKWWRTVEVHLKGTLLCTRAVLPSMLRRRRGRIINLSGGGAGGPYPHLSAYGCAKAAVVRFTDTLAAEVRTYNLAAFAVRPGWVRTAMTEEVLNTKAGRRWVPQAREQFEQGRDFPPDDTARLVTFLASGRGDALSGRCLYVAHDVADLVRRARQIQDEDLYTLRYREEGSATVAQVALHPIP